MDKDLGKMIKQLLSDDATAAALKSAAQAIVAGDSEPSAEEPEASEELLPDVTEGINIQSIYDTLGMGADKRVCLLNALKPYLSERRKPKLEGAITIAQMAGLSEGLGLVKMFRGKGL